MPQISNPSIPFIQPSVLTACQAIRADLQKAIDAGEAIMALVVLMILMVLWYMYRSACLLMGKYTSYRIKCFLNGVEIVTLDYPGENIENSHVLAGDHWQDWAMSAGPSWSRESLWTVKEQKGQNN